MNIYVALLIGYSAALTALGLWIARRVRGPADFFVAGRTLTWPYIAATMLAANIGAGATVGATGLAYQQGVSAWFWNGSAGIGSLLLATLIGPRIWKLAADRNYLTVGDFLEDRYGQSVRVIIASLIWFGALFILAGQLLLGAAVFSVVAGLPKWAGVLIGGAAMTGYFSAGGLLSSVGVSVVQLVVKFTGFAIAIPILLNAAGGLDAIAQTPGVPETFFNPLFSAGASSGFTLLLLSGPNFVVSPGLIQKTYGAESARAVKLEWARTRSRCLIFAFLPVFLGLSAPGVVPRNRRARSGAADAVAAWPSRLAWRAGARRGVLGGSRRLRSDSLHALDVALPGSLQARRQPERDSGAGVDGRAQSPHSSAGARACCSRSSSSAKSSMLLTVFYSIIGATLLVPVVGGLFVREARTRDALASIAAGHDRVSRGAVWHGSIGLAQP